MFLKDHLSNFSLLCGLCPLSTLLNEMSVLNKLEVFVDMCAREVQTTMCNDRVVFLSLFMYRFSISCVYF